MAETPNESDRGFLNFCAFSGSRWRLFVLVLVHIFSCSLRSPVKSTLTRHNNHYPPIIPHYKGRCIKSHKAGCGSRQVLRLVLEFLAFRGCLSISKVGRIASHHILDSIGDLRSNGIACSCCHCACLSKPLIVNAICTIFILNNMSSCIPDLMHLLSYRLLLNPVA